MIVADTNLVAYLLVPSGRSEAAEAVRLRDPTWGVPPLWRSELRSVLVQSLRGGTMTRIQADAASADAEALLAHNERAPETARVLDVALEHGLSSYDAEFVALAEELGVPLVTDDRRVLKACADVAVSIDDFARDADASGR